MPGIKLRAPVGTGWEYMMDGGNWQDSPKFLTQPGGQPFELGTLYTIHCRKQDGNQTIQRDVTIPFGETDSEPTLDIIARRGSSAKKGWTDQLLRLMGGLIADLPTTTNLDLPQVVIDAEKKLWKRGGKILEEITIDGPASFPINQVGTFTATAHYSDGSSGPALGALFTVSGPDAVINFATGVMTPGPNAQLNTPYTVSVSWQGLSDSMQTTLTPESVAFTLRGAPKYFMVVPVLGPDWDGSVDKITCYDVYGWIADRNHVNTPAQGRLFINGIFVGLVTATITRPDVSLELGWDNNTGHIYGWRYQIPAAYRNGGPLTVELRPLSGTNAMRLSPTTINDGCLDTSTLINVAAGKTVSASNQEGGDSTWSPGNMTDENPATNYSSTCLLQNDPLVFTIDLNGTAKAQEIILSRRNNDGPLPVAYQFDGSVDGTSWFRMVTVNAQDNTTAGDVILPVEKDVNGLYRDVRYVRFTSITNVMVDCYRVQLAGVQVRASYLTPLGEQPPTRLPQKLLLLGDAGMSENSYKPYQVLLIYNNNDSEDVTSTATLSLESGVAATFALVGGQARLTAGDDGTTTPVRTVRIKASLNGLSTTRDVDIYNATVEDYIVRYRIDWATSVTTLTEGTSNTVKITAEMHSGALASYIGSGAYSINAPYPDGMTATTGANAIGTLNLPMGSITADLPITVRFTFPGQSGFIEKTISLINVADNNVTFQGYEIVGDATITESQTAAVTKSYQVVEKYSDGSTRNFTGGGAYAISGNYPNGMGYTTAPGNTGAGTVTLAPNSITGNASITLLFTFSDNSVITKVIQLTNVADPQAVQIDQVVMWNKGAHSGSAGYYDIWFLYKATLGSGVVLEDCWVESFAEFSQTPEFLTASTLNPLQAPAGYENFNYVMSYDITKAHLTQGTTQHLRIRKQGTTTNLLEITFNPTSLQPGQVLTIYTAP